MMPQMNLHNGLDDTTLNLLAGLPLFSKLSDDQIQRIAEHATVRVFPKNAIIINEGDSADSLYVTLTGKVKVFLSDDSGKEIIVNILEANEYFGELALIDDAKRSASVMTIERSSFLVISKEDFKRLLGNHPDIAVQLINDLTKRVRSLTDNVKSLALQDVYGRVAKMLFSIAKQEEGQMVVKEKLTQQDIANRVGASREMVARILKDLASGGYISHIGRKIIIHDNLPRSY